MCSWPLPASISLGPNGFRLRRRKLAEPSRIGSGFRIPCWFAAQVSEYRKAFPEQKLGAEVATPEEALLLARAGIDSIQCERFTCADLEETVRGVKAVNAAVQVLAAGGVTGENAEAVAATGVDVLVTTWAYFGKPADIKMVVSA